MVPLKVLSRVAVKGHKGKSLGFGVGRCLEVEDLGLRVQHVEISVTGLQSFPVAHAAVRITLQFRVPETKPLNPKPWLKLSKPDFPRLNMGVR